jgi:transcription-repair coupling factor (superfamily II helicase)
LGAASTIGRDKLYVPVDRLDYLEKYSSAESATPKLDRLGGTGWERVQKRVKKSMRDMAPELLKLYAAREHPRGTAFLPTAHGRESSRRSSSSRKHRISDRRSTT